MRNYLTLLVVLLSLFSAHAQNIEVVQSQRSFGGYIGIGSKLTTLTTQQDIMQMLSAEVGLTFNKKFNIGIEAAASLTDIHTVWNRYQYLNTAAVRVEPIFRGDRAVSFTIPISFGVGAIVETNGALFDVESWEHSYYEPEVKDVDGFLYLEPGFNVEFNLSRMIHLRAGGAIRLAADAGEYSAEHIIGPSFNAGLKFGWM